MESNSNSIESQQLSEEFWILTTFQKETFARSSLLPKKQSVKVFSDGFVKLLFVQQHKFRGCIIVSSCWCILEVGASQIGSCKLFANRTLHFLQQGVTKDKERQRQIQR